MPLGIGSRSDAGCRADEQTADGDRGAGLAQGPGKAPENFGFEGHHPRNPASIARCPELRRPRGHRHLRGVQPKPRSFTGPAAADY